MKSKKQKYYINRCSSWIKKGYWTLSWRRAWVCSMFQHKSKSWIKSKSASIRFIFKE